MQTFRVRKISRAIHRRYNDRSYHALTMTLQTHCTFLGALAACFLNASGVGNAQPTRQSEMNCALYDRLDRQCGCKGTDEYFVSYGRRYCQRFLRSSGWTSAGTRWRDQTLVCLQQSLSRAMHQDAAHVCSCQNTRDIAWQSHVRCYTQASASVCRLPLSDLLKIYSIIDAADLLNPFGFSQVLAIANTCLTQRR